MVQLVSSAVLGLYTCMVKLLVPELTFLMIGGIVTLDVVTVLDPTSPTKYPVFT
jgi:hypothetical protein